MYGAGAGDELFVNSHNSDEVEAPRIQVQFMRKDEKVHFRAVSDVKLWPFQELSVARGKPWIEVQ